MTYVFEPAKQATLPIKGSDKLFPIHRIYCVGRNYDEHTKEMGGDTKDPPFFFQKNADNVATNGKFPYPSQTKNVHFEIEMVVGLKSGGVNIKTDDALKHVFGYAVGIDMTRRDLQDVAKKMARPWEVAKAFEASAPCTALVPARRHRASEQGGHLAGRQRRAATDRRSQPDDLGRAEPDRVPVDPVRAEGRRPDLQRHPVRRRCNQARAIA